MAANSVIAFVRTDKRPELPLDHDDSIIAAALQILEQRARYGDPLTSPASVRQFLQLRFTGLEREVFTCVFLDAQNRVIETEDMFAGTLTQTSVYPREVVKAALRHNAAAVILAHNHPSGVPEPSHADQAITTCLKSALALVDVKVLDHFVIAGTRSTSFAERGML